MKKMIGLIEILIGFLLLSIIIACFLKASIYQEENQQIEKAKQDINQIHQQAIQAQKEKKVIIEVEDTKSEQIPQKHKVKNKKLVPQFIEILD